MKNNKPEIINSVEFIQNEFELKETNKINNDQDITKNIEILELFYNELGIQQTRKGEI